MRLFTTKRNSWLRWNRHVPLQNRKIIFPLWIVIDGFHSAFWSPLLGLLFLATCRKKVEWQDALQKRPADRSRVVTSWRIDRRVATLIYPSSGIHPLTGYVIYCCGNRRVVCKGNEPVLKTGKQINPLIEIQVYLQSPTRPYLKSLACNTTVPTTCLCTMGPNVAGVIGSAVAAGILLDSYHK